MLRTGQYGLSVRVPVYTTSGCMRRNMSHNAFAYYSAESVFVVEERKTCSHGMGRHGTRIRAAYMCVLLIGVLQQKIQRISRENPRTGRHVKDVFIAYIPDTYVYRIR